MIKDSDIQLQCHPGVLGFWVTACLIEGVYFFVLDGAVKVILFCSLLYY